MSKFTTRFFLMAFVMLLCQHMTAMAKSGIFLRGEVNSWAADAEWEFADEGSGIYSLADKTLSGNFKIADASWSASCNYGAGTGTLAMGQPYQLTGGSNPGNISCGTNTFQCKRIELRIISDTEATLTLRTDDDGSALTKVYVIGDCNGWDFGDSTCVLRLASAADSTFSGRVTMPSAAGDGLSRWNIFQKLGMGGRWGLAADAASSVTDGTLGRGLTGRVATSAGTYDITFSTKTGAFSMTVVPSMATTLTVEPAQATLLSAMPDTIRLLSLNNSLINYARQDTIWNNIVRAQDKHAFWTSHSNIGKSLDYQWKEEDDTGNNVEGQPSARTMIKSQPWTHIILQEQTERPRKNFELFRECVSRWVTFIRENCPNPQAVILLPVNWALRGDFNQYRQMNAILEENYRKVARETGVVLVPVGEAYEDCYEREGTGELATWFRPAGENNGTDDDRHPSKKATYMAACTEYGVIFGEDPRGITYLPSGLDATTAARMRDYAKAAIDSLAQVVDNHARTITYSATLYDQFGMPMTAGQTVNWSADRGGTITDGVFRADGTEGVTAVTAQCGAFTGTATVTVGRATGAAPAVPTVIWEAGQAAVGEAFDTMDGGRLPAGWRIDRLTGSPRTLGYFASAADTVMYVQTEANITLPSNAKNGTWSFGSGTDRALGGISTGVANATRCVNVYLHVRNVTDKDLADLQLAYDVEKYRMGSNAAGFSVQLYSSPDGSQWTTAGENFLTTFTADSKTAGYKTIPGESRQVSASLPVTLPSGGDLYLAWNISVASGTTCNAAQALAIDNVRLWSATTDIRTLRKPARDGSCYNLAGQRVGQGYRGIVIQNSRKVVRR